MKMQIDDDDLARLVKRIVTRVLDEREASQKLFRFRVPSGSSLSHSYVKEQRTPR